MVIANNITMKIIGNIRNLRGAKAGYLAESTGGQTYPNGLTLAQNALYQEKGTSKIPPRPFMAKGAENFEQRKGEVSEIVLQAIEHGRSGNVAIGVLLAQGIQKAITDGGFQANAPQTVKRKGSSKPLMDTGALRQGVDSRVLK